MSVASFLKSRMDQVAIVDSANYVWAVFAYPSKIWTRRNFKSTVRPMEAGGGAHTEINNMPFWHKKNDSTDTLSIYAAGGSRSLIPLGSGFVAATYHTYGEVVSFAQFPLRGYSSGTKIAYFDFNGGTAVNVALTAVINDGEGNLWEIVQALNADAGFKAAGIGEAFVAGSGDAAKLGIRCKTAGNTGSVEILFTGADNCCALLGFSEDNENVYDEGDNCDLVGTYTQSSDAKAT